jgi:hypothetical protein
MTSTLRDVLEFRPGRNFVRVGDTVRVSQQVGRVSSVT